jgi:hypothetical protein
MHTTKRSVKRKHWGTNLSHTCAIVSGETALYTIGRRYDISNPLPIDLFGIGPHARNGQYLLVLLNALLELAKQNAETCGQSMARKESTQADIVPPA